MSVLCHMGWLGGPGIALGAGSCWMGFWWIQTRLVHTPSIHYLLKKRPLQKSEGNVSEQISGRILRAIFGWIFWAPFPGKTWEKPTPKSTAKFKSNFGSFVAKIHTARIWS